MSRDPMDVLPDDAERGARPSAPPLNALQPMRDETHHALTSVAVMTWLLFTFAILVTLVATFVVAVSDSEEAPRVAAIMGTVTVGVGGLATLISSTEALRRRSFVAVVIFVALCLLAIRLGFALLPLAAG